MTYLVKCTDTAGNKSESAFPTYAKARAHYDNRYANRRAWNYRRVELVGADGFPMSLWDAKIAESFK